MCFGSRDGRASGDAPPHPVPLTASGSGNNNSDRKAGNRSAQQQQYAPPPGPPPSTLRQNATAPVHNDVSEDYAPPPGPPPVHGSSGGVAADDYAPPIGPPPTHGRAGGDAAGDYAPPPGPPPGHGHGQGQDRAGGGGAPPPSQHDWETAVPDTALLPPPPNLFAGWDRSPANNATEVQAEAGEAWCRQHPLNFPPLDLQQNTDSNAAVRAAIADHNIGLLTPPGFQGELRWVGPGRWAGKTTSRHAPDSCILAYPPLYAPSLHSPLTNGGGKPFTAYYEVFVRPHEGLFRGGGGGSSSSSEVSLALGFAALPYPPFRLPGWHRGSLAVHGDDGHRYVNDLWGGKDFLPQAFRPGGTYGIGLTFAADPSANNGLRVEVFFTVDGARAGGWDLHEETDAAQDRPVTGLEGFHDLSLAVGTFSQVAFEVRLAPALWLYKGVEN